MDTPSNKPLFGLRVLVTRSREQASDLSTRLIRLGAEPIEAPVIRIEDPEDWTSLDQALAQITTYDWLIFTSTNSIDQFFKRFFEKDLKVGALASTRIAVVGRATATRLQEHGLIADHQPNQFNAEALVEKLVKNEVMEKTRILFPGANIARKTIVDGLTAYGAEVLPVTVYRTVTVETLPDEIISMLEQKMIHLVTFASSSTVRAFTQTLGEHGLTRLEGVTIGCIGPVTRSTARDVGLSVDIMPEEASITALIDAIVQYRHHSQ